MDAASICSEVVRGTVESELCEAKERGKLIPSSCTPEYFKLIAGGEAAESEHLAEYVRLH